MPAVVDVHHVKLPVSDLARSREWYERVLGFAVTIEFEEDGVVRGLALRRGPAQIALRHDPARAAALAGFDALALRVPTAADVAEWGETLDEPHGGIVNGHTGGSVLVGLHDPDGIEIRLYADPPDLPVTWTDRGCGELVLLVHAGVFGAWFDPLADALTGCRVVTVRRAGYTDGPAPDRPVEIADHAAHLARLLEHLDAGPATVVGHSSGSAVVMQLALDRPDLVHGLVLCEPPLIDALADPADLETVHAILGPAVGAAMGAAHAGDLPAAFAAFMTAVCGPGHRDVLLAALGADGLARAVDGSGFFFVDELPAMGRWAVDPARITTPTLLVQGGESPAATQHLVARLAGTIPGARVATIEGDDHLLPLRSPAALARLVDTALAGGDRTVQDVSPHR